MSLVKADGRQQRPGWYKQDTLVFPLLDPGQQIGSQRYRRAAAAASPGMGILGCSVVDLNPAVHVLFLDINPLFPKELDENLLPHIPQIAGYNPIIILRLPTKIRKMLIDGIAGRRSHGSPHILRILDAVIHDPAWSRPCNLRLSFA